MTYKFHMTKHSFDFCFNHLKLILTLQSLQKKKKDKGGGQ